MKVLFPAIILFSLFLLGCSSGDNSSIENGSPTTALIRGDIDSSEYFAAVTKANIQARESEQFEVDRDPTRAYNTRTGEIEFVPQDTQQYWNEEKKRWEFTPVKSNED